MAPLNQSPNPPNLSRGTSLTLASLFILTTLVILPQPANAIPTLSTVSDIVVNTYASASFNCPTVAVAPDGTIGVAWADVVASGKPWYFVKSTDGGTTWSPKVQILANSLTFQCLKLTILSNTNFIVAPHGSGSAGSGGVFAVSINAGTSWGQSSPSCGNLPLTQVVYHFASSQIWAIGSSGVVSGSQVVRSCFTTNAGSSWTSPATNAPGTSIVDILSCGGACANLYMTSASNCCVVAQTTNSGTSYTTISGTGTVGTGSNVATDGASTIVLPQWDTQFTQQQIDVKFSTNNGASYTTTVIDAISPTAASTTWRGGFGNGLFTFASLEATTNKILVLSGNPLQGFQDAYTTLTSVNNGQPIILYRGNNQAVIIYQGASDNTLHAATITLSVPATPISTLSVSNIRGFDVDPFNYGILARTGASAPQTIRTYDPSSLTESGTFAETTCNRDDGVSVSTRNNRVFASFVNCDSGGFVDRIHIRNGAMGEPDQSGTVCESGTDFCDIDIETGDCSIQCVDFSTDELPGGIKNLGRMASALPDWNTGGLQSNPHALLSWTFSDQGNGNIGVWAIEQVDESQDQTYIAQSNFNSASPYTVDDWCSWRDIRSSAPAPYDHVAAVRSLGGTKSYDVNLVDIEDYESNFSDPTLSVNINAQSTTVIEKAVAISCSQNLALILTQTGTAKLVYITGPGSGTLATTTTFSAAAPITRGSALNQGTATCGAYMAGTTIHILNLTSANPREVGTFPSPSGTLIRMVMDFDGKNLWVATGGSTGSINRYDVSTLCNTSQNPTGLVIDHATGEKEGCVDITGATSPNCNGNSPPGSGCLVGCPSSSSSTGTGGVVALFGDTALIFPGFPDAGSAFIGVLLIMVIAAGFYFIHKSALMAGGGATIGAFLAFTFGLFPLWMILVLVLLAATITVLRFRSGS